MNETASLPQKETYFKKILLFSIPLMLTGILQSLYNAADLIVVGRFDGNLALAAVGARAVLQILYLECLQVFQSEQVFALLTVSALITKRT